MRRKSPWIAGVLNFFLPGLGFAYLGGTTFLVSGIGLFVVALMDVAATSERSLRPGEVITGLLAAFALAGLAAETALLRNRLVGVAPATAGRFCTQCGAELATDDIHCKACGKKA